MADSQNIVQSRRALYVGGLGDDVSQTTLRAAMIPFGPIKSIEIVSSPFSPALTHAPPHHHVLYSHICCIFILALVHLSLSLWITNRAYTKALLLSSTKTQM